MTTIEGTHVLRGIDCKSAMARVTESMISDARFGAVRSRRRLSHRMHECHDLSAERRHIRLVNLWGAMQIVFGADVQRRVRTIIAGRAPCGSPVSWWV